MLVLYIYWGKKESIHFCNYNHFLIRTEMLNSIKIYCLPQQWIKLTFPKLHKRDSSGDRLSNNRKSSCFGNIDYKTLFFKQ